MYWRWVAGFVGATALLAVGLGLFPTAMAWWDPVFGDALGGIAVWVSRVAALAVFELVVLGIVGLYARVRHRRPPRPVGLWGGLLLALVLAAGDAALGAWERPALSTLLRPVTAVPTEQARERAVLRTTRNRVCSAMLLEELRDVPAGAWIVDMEVDRTGGLVLLGWFKAASTGDHRFYKVLRLTPTGDVVEGLAPPRVCLTDEQGRDPTYAIVGLAELPKQGEIRLRTQRGVERVTESGELELLREVTLEEEPFEPEPAVIQGATYARSGPIVIRMGEDGMPDRTFGRMVGTTLRNFRFEAVQALTVGKSNKLYLAVGQDMQSEWHPIPVEIVVVSESGALLDSYHFVTER